MKRDKFGRELRKIVQRYIHPQEILEYYFTYWYDNLNESSATMEETIKDFAIRQKLPLKETEQKPKSGFRKPSSEQIKRHNEWVKESKKKAAENLASKPKKEVKKVTKRQHQIESKYNKVLAKILEERPPHCESCGMNKPRDPSHLVPRSFSKALICEPDNIMLQCRDCHEKVELGLWDELLNGEAIKQYIKRVAPKYYFIKMYKNKNK